MEKAHLNLRYFFYYKFTKNNDKGAKYLFINKHSQFNDLPYKVVYEGIAIKKGTCLRQQNNNSSIEVKTEID